jgi:hypothetical protein
MIFLFNFICRERLIFNSFCIVLNDFCLVFGFGLLRLGSIVFRSFVLLQLGFVLLFDGIVGDGSNDLVHYFLFDGCRGSGDSLVLLFYSFSSLFGLTLGSWRGFVAAFSFVTCMCNRFSII